MRMLKRNTMQETGIPKGRYIASEDMPGKLIESWNVNTPTNIAVRIHGDNRTFAENSIYQKQALRNLQTINCIEVTTKSVQLLSEYKKTCLDGSRF